MADPIRRPLLAAAAVLLLAGTGYRCELIQSDVRLVADDATLIDLPGFDGTFIYEGYVPFELVRLGGGQYEYAGPVLRLFDFDHVTPAEIAALEERFTALGLPEPEHASDGELIPPPALASQLRKLDARCPWTGIGNRRCAVILGEILEPDYPGVLAFAQTVDRLPSVEIRERARLSLHKIGESRLVAQIEEITEHLSQRYHELEERWPSNPEFELDFWADYLRRPPALQHWAELTSFEESAESRSLVLLQPLTDGSFALHLVDHCWSAEHLVAYGFTPRTDGQGQLVAIAGASGADLLGMLNACFPEDVSDAHRFWRIDASPPPSAAPAD
jgi:hypothetical protein